MGDNRTDWRTALVEAATGPAIAILFWFMILVIVTLSLAQGPWFDANIFEAFGAIGQVIFAAGVFWLAYQQFEFTKRTTERQHRVETYSIRRALLDRFIQYADLAAKIDDDNRDFGENFLGAGFELADEIGQVFSKRASDEAFAMVEKLALLPDDTEWRRQLHEKYSGDLPGEMAELQNNWKAMNQHRFEAWNAMYQEMSITEL